ncbi:unnamed protein product [Brassica oleracea var. botrytis]|uniref:Uncharacterized protein n=1 Tax=Brassica oleracea TaxID=3712 RepID=A0A3P6DPA5_BRAOL|nr:unnamed protein product [Brassica oleracea]
MALSVSSRKGETTNPRFDFSASSIFGSFTIQTNRASSCSSFIRLSWAKKEGINNTAKVLHFQCFVSGTKRKRYASGTPTGKDCCFTQ